MEFRIHKINPKIMILEMPLIYGYFRSSTNMAVVFQFQPVEKISMHFLKSWVYVSGKVLRGECTFMWNILIVRSWNDTQKCVWDTQFIIDFQFYGGRHIWSYGSIFHVYHVTDRICAVYKKGKLLVTYGQSLNSFTDRQCI